MKSITNYRDLYRELYNLGTTKLHAIYGAFRSTGVNSFENFIFEYSRDTVIEITQLNRGGDGLTHGEMMQLDVFCFGISYMYRLWIEGNHYHLSPDEAADHLYAIMPETLKHYWFPNASK